MNDPPRHPMRHAFVAPFAEQRMYNILKATPRGLFSRSLPLRKDRVAGDGAMPF